MAGGSRTPKRPADNYLGQFHSVSRARDVGYPLAGLDPGRLQRHRPTNATETNPTTWPVQCSTAIVNRHQAPKCVMCVICVMCVTVDTPPLPSLARQRTSALDGFPVRAGAKSAATQLENHQHHRCYSAMTSRGGQCGKRVMRVTTTGR